MTSDIRLAFEHPEARAAATAPAAQHDRLSLRDHIREVDIGAFQSERGRRQRLCFNVVAELRPHGAPLDDDVDRILSYDTITEAIDAELAAERLNLLETLAERIAERILAAPQALRVFVRIEKLDRGPGALGVEIVRTRGQAPLRPISEEDSAAAPQPTVVLLANTAIASDRLPGWIDALVASGRPAILCVGAPDRPAPRSAAPAAQRRIDLLAIEQNAWVLAGRDRRCVVVATRTELDWAMKNRQLCVWAPSKIVLDAIDGPSASPRDAAALAAWFARLMQAEELVIIGMDPPIDAGLPVRALDPGAGAVV